VVDISYDCGFNNLSHFNKQFKKFINKTPTQYRKLRDSSVDNRHGKQLTASF